MSWDQGSGEIHVSTLGDEPHFTYGSRGGWQFSERIEGGFGIYYSYHRFAGKFSSDLYALQSTYSTWYLEPTLHQTDHFTISTPIHLGYGWGSLQGQYPNSFTEYATYLILQPGVQVNFYPVDWIKLYVGGSYRYHIGSSYNYFNAANLSSPTAFFGVGFGSY